MRSLLPPVAAVVLLVVGYADLAAGGNVLAATLLVLGYAAAVPAAILIGSASRRQPPDVIRLPR